MTDENLAPVEVFERIVERYAEEAIEPKLAVLAKQVEEARANARAEKQAREVLATELAAARDGFRRDMDVLNKVVASLLVELDTCKVRDALSLIQITYLSASQQSGVNQELLARKYESSVSMLDESKDPLELAGQFKRFVIAHCEARGAKLISPGLSVRSA